MNPVQIISGPAIGAVIGYFTNYIAVKMLFRPYKPVKIGKWTLPFTPGVIPRRKGDLARAIGNAIENNLLGGNDIRSMLTGPETCSAVADSVWQAIEDLLVSGATASGLIDNCSFEGKSAAIIESAAGTISLRAGEKLAEMDLGTAISEIAGEAVTRKMQSSMLGMFVTPDVIRSFLGPLAQGINQYIAAEGPAKISEFVTSELTALSGKPLGELISIGEETKSGIKNRIASVYTEFMSANAEKLTANMKTGRIVEEKINAMDVADFEKLIMSVMKHELSAIVNLGAVIGLVIGVINIFL